MTYLQLEDKTEVVSSGEHVIQLQQTRVLQTLHHVDLVLEHTTGNMTCLLLASNWFQVGTHQSYAQFIVGINMTFCESTLLFFYKLF